MENSMKEKIKKLKEKIKTIDVTEAAKGTEEWGGADVIITAEMNESIKDWIGSQPLVISFQKTAPRRRLVLTNYSRELSWLFFELKAIFYDKLDYIIKYDFYGSLAQAALEYIEEHKKKVMLKPLLLAVLKMARKFEI